MLFRSTILVRAERPGHATLLFWRSENEPTTLTFQILKGKDPLPPHREQVLAFLNSLEDAKVIQSTKDGADSKELVVLQGEIRTLSEGRRIRTFSRARPDQVTNQTYPSENLFRSCLKDLRAKLRTRESEDLKLEFSESDRWIAVTGLSPSAGRQNTIENQLGNICPWTTFQIDVDSPKLDLIRLKVVLIESYQRNEMILGMKSGLSNTSQLQINSSRWLSHFGVISTLKALETRGRIKILSQPEIVLRTPGEAELFSGGELPIETTSRNSSQVLWKNIGLGLKVKTLQTTSKKVRLDLSAEVSQIDISLSTDRFPGLQANRLKTQVEANFGEPLLLSGLFKSVVSNETNGVPFLGRLPFLNLFFAETSSSNIRTELLAILIPYREVPRLSRERIYGLQKKY